jgi:ubiquitin carboxyl-terminal hydrolase 34
MESVPADHNHHVAPPASPLRRDSMEDADSSLTRKRPRLDSGSGEVHGMAANRDAAAPDKTSTHKASEPVEVTINIRSQPPSTQPEAAPPSEMANGSSTSPAALSQASAPVVEQPSEDNPTHAEDNPSPDSPPVLAIDDDDDAVGEAMDEYAEPQFIHIATEEEVPEEYYQRFPFVEGRSHSETLRILANHLHTAVAVEGRVLPDLTEWLEGLPNRPAYWVSYYLDYAYFWDEFFSLVQRLLTRR